MTSTHHYPTFEQGVFNHSERLDTCHRLITTNIPEKPIQERLEIAKVVFLLRDENHEGDPFNRKLLQSKGDKNHYILTEDTHFSNYFHLNSEKKVRLWVPNERIKCIEHEINVLLSQAIYASNKLVKNITQKALVIEDANKEDSDAEFCPNDAIDSIKNEIRKYLSEVEKLNTTCEDLTRRYCLYEAMFLVHLIQVNAPKYQKIWIVINEGRGRYTNSKIEIMQHVSYLYLSLQAAKISYITLKYSSPQFNQLEYVHLPEMAQPVETFYKKKIEKDLKTCEQTLRSLSPVEQSIILLGLSRENFPDIRPSQKLPTIRLLLSTSLTWE